MDSEAVTLFSPGTALVESPAGLFKPGSLTGGANYASDVVARALLGSDNAPPLDLLTSYPTYLLVSAISELSIPRTSLVPSQEDRRKESTRSGSTTSSRLAALFTKAPAPLDSTVDDLPPAVPVRPGIMSNSSASSDSSPTDNITYSHSSRSPVPNLVIHVCAIGKTIRHGDVLRGISKALDQHLREPLKLIEGTEGDASNVIDRVCGFASRFSPPHGWLSSLPSTTNSGGGRSTNESLYAKCIDEISDEFQDMLHATRLDLARNIRAAIAKERKKEKHLDVAAAAGEREEEDELNAIEDRVDASLEKVEQAITSTLYDRLFCPPTSGDFVEDENLSSRVACLNILELSLDHLGLDLGKVPEPEGWEEGNKSIRDSLEDVVWLAGQELDRLSDSSRRPPSAKLAVFVSIHKIIVDGVSRLPPIPLKDSSAPPKDSQDVEMDDASFRVASRGPTRSSSPRRDDDDQQRTPRPKLSRGPSMPEINLPSTLLSARSTSQSSSASSLNGELASSMADATTSSVFDSGPRRELASTASSSADLILPLLIYLIVRYNPLRLASTLNYVQRFRAESLMRGESSYCATNIQAAIEFLTTVDISTLGLNSQRVLSSDVYPSSPPLSVRSSKSGMSGRIKGRVTNELDNFVDSANSALVNVVDSSYKMLFGPKGFGPKTIEDVRNVLDGAGSVASKARGTLLRRTSSASQFGLAGAGTRDDSNSHQGQRELIDIPHIKESEEGEQEFVEKDLSKSDDAVAVGATLGVDNRTGVIPGLGIVRSRPSSISSGNSTLSSKPVANSTVHRRTTVSHPVGSVASSTANGTTSSSALSVVEGSPSPGITANHRFLNCEPGDLRVGEVGELLLEYRRVFAELERLRACPPP